MARTSHQNDKLSLVLFVCDNEMKIFPRLGCGSIFLMPSFLLTISILGAGAVKNELRCELILENVCSEQTVLQIELVNTPGSMFIVSLYDLIVTLTLI